MKRLACLLALAACGKGDNARQEPAPAPVAPSDARAPDATVETYYVDTYPPDAQGLAEQLVGPERNDEPGCDPGPCHPTRARNDTGPAPAPSEPRGRATIAEKQSLDDTTLTDDQVLAKVMAAYLSGVKACYRSSLKRDPAARGKMILAFDVTASGTVGKHSATGFDAELDRCVTAQIAAWRFAVPKDKDGDATDASFQLTIQLVPD